MQERIDPIYKDLTKGKAAPMGGVAYLSAEEYEVELSAFAFKCMSDTELGTLHWRHQVSRYAANEAIQRYGAAIGW